MIDFDPRMVGRMIQNPTDMIHNPVRTHSMFLTYKRMNDQNLTAETVSGGSGDNTADFDLMFRAMRPAMGPNKGTSPSALHNGWHLFVCALKKRPTMPTDSGIT